MWLPAWILHEKSAPESSIIIWEIFHEMFYFSLTDFQGNISHIVQMNKVAALLD